LKRTIGEFGAILNYDAPFTQRGRFRCALEIGVKTVLAMRKMKNGGPYKPYAIIDQHAFDATVGELQKGTPL
jgi:hypothetical protein